MQRGEVVEDGEDGGKEELRWVRCECWVLGFQWKREGQGEEEKGGLQ